MAAQASLVQCVLKRHCVFTYICREETVAYIVRDAHYLNAMQGVTWQHVACRCWQLRWWVVAACRESLEASMLCERHRLSTGPQKPSARCGPMPYSAAFQAEACVRTTLHRNWRIRGSAADIGCDAAFQQCCSQRPLGPAQR